MVTTKALQSRKREYIVVRHGQMYYWARAERDKPDTYVIMTAATEKEAREIATKANETSRMNAEIDKIYDVADKFMDNWEQGPKDETE